MALYQRKRLRSDCSSLSEHTVSSSGRGAEDLNEGDSRQQQLLQAREEHAAARLQLEELRRASRERQGHLLAQLQELEGCSAASSSMDAANGPDGAGRGVGGGKGGGGGSGGGICVGDLHGQLKAYEAQEQEAAAKLLLLEQQHRARVAALLGQHHAAAQHVAAPAAEQNGAPACGPSQQQPPCSDPMQATPNGSGAGQRSSLAMEHGQEEEQLLPAGAGLEQQPQWRSQQQQLQQEEEEKQDQETPHAANGAGAVPGPAASTELQAALQREAARVESEMARVAMQQQLAESALGKPRSSKKARTDSITQVWEWLQRGGSGGGGGGGGAPNGGGASPPGDLWAPANGGHAGGGGEAEEQQQQQQHVQQLPVQLLSQEAATTSTG